VIAGDGHGGGGDVRWDRARFTLAGRRARGIPSRVVAMLIDDDDP
jgi:hypothetical protein